MWTWTPRWWRKSARFSTRRLERRAWRAGSGRMLSAMDEELLAMVQPFYTPKLNYSQRAGHDVDAGVLDEPSFTPAVTMRDRLSGRRRCWFTATRSRGVNGGQLVSAPAPVARRVRGFFAPVNRGAQSPVVFDPVQQGRFSMDTPPAHGEPGLDTGLRASPAARRHP